MRLTHAYVSACVYVGSGNQTACADPASAEVGVACFHVSLEHNGILWWQVGGESSFHNWSGPGHWEGLSIGEQGGRHTWFVRAKLSHASCTSCGYCSMQKCASEGARVIATDVNAEKLQELQKEQPSIVTDSLDVTKGADVERMLKEKHSDVNVLFTVLGQGGRGKGMKGEGSVSIAANETLALYCMQ